MNPSARATSELRDAVQRPDDPARRRGHANVKRRYDPTSPFHRNRNVPPAANR